MRMMTRVTRRFVTTLVTLVAAAAALRAQSALSDSADVERLVRVLAVESGQTVGEIGAGSGKLTVAMAKIVGESGHVLSNELNKGSLAKIGTAAEAAGLKNVTLVEGAPDETRFPAGSCDAIFMRNVYHHFGDPPKMNTSLLQSLKPGGRLAIIDFGPPPGGENPPGERGLDKHHGVTAPTVERELKAVGFDVVSSEPIAERVFLVVARRPQS